MMPNEVMNESSKIFAIFLLGNARIWRSARLQLEDFPTLPEDLTEQQNAVPLVVPLSTRWHGAYADDGAKSVVTKLAQEKTRTIEYPKLGNTTGDRKAMDDFVELRHNVIKEELKQRDALLKWLAKRDSNRSEELRQVRKLRLQDVKAHLEKSGYSPEILGLVPDSHYENFPTMHQSKRLTNQAWKKYKPLLEAALERSLSVVRQDAFTAACERFKRVLDDPSRRYRDFVYCHSPINLDGHQFTPAIDEALRDWALVEENCVSLCQKRKDDQVQLPDHILELVAPFLENRREQIVQQFNDLALSSGRFSELHVTKDTFDLAICVFMLPSDVPSENHIAVPYWLAHCLDEGKPTWFHGDLDKSTFSWIFDANASDVFRKIITVSGQDPDTCTRQMFLDMGEYVRCLQCTKENTMPLETSALHWVQAHAGQDPATGSWQLLNASESLSFDDIWRKEHDTPTPEVGRALRRMGFFGGFNEALWRNE
ncbi:hypothetical protein DL93DRAFT_2097876 [Clavulina sp. PMI_390]|nr:hypothetical protein DL93DRAFT_2097876 [Clavulina sp. PMI_390]